jgi:vitamin B12 transporter
VGALLLLAERLEQAVDKPGSNYAVQQRAINAFGAGLNGSADAHTWQASVRHDRNSQYGNQTTGALAYGLALSPAWRLSASGGSFFVAPSFNQLYYPGFANPALQPEEGREAEAGVHWQGGGHGLHLTVFENRITHYIVNRTVGGVLQPVNIARAQVNGLTLAHDASLGDWTWTASYDHTDPQNKSGTDSSAGKLLPRRSRDALKAGLDRRFGAFSAGASVQGFGHRYDNEANTTRVGGFATADLRADWRITPDWTLQARLNNLADKTFETANGYNQPGREVYLTVRWALR